MSIEIRFKRVLEEIPSRGKILDIGCNVYPRNALHRFILYVNKNCTGLDWQKGEGVDVVWDLNKKLPFKDGEFDVIVHGDTIDHLENPKMNLEECCRILKVGGKLILTTQNAIGLPNILHGKIGACLMTFTMENIFDNMELVGMEIEKFEYINAFYKKNYLFRFICFLLPRLRPILFVVAKKIKQFDKKNLLKKQKNIYKTRYKYNL